LSLIDAPANIVGVKVPGNAPVLVGVVTAPRAPDCCVFVGVVGVFGVGVVGFVGSVVSVGVVVMVGGVVVSVGGVDITTGGVVTSVGGVTTPGVILANYL
jgi:hypothetical protein